MQYGNCLLVSCVILLNKKKRKKKSKVVLRFRPESYTPHFMVKSENQLYHYKLEKNILSWPFCYLIFKGNFQVLDEEKEFLFTNQNAKIIWTLSISLFLVILLVLFIN